MPGSKQGLGRNALLLTIPCCFLEENYKAAAIIITIQSPLHFCFPMGLGKLCHWETPDIVYWVAVNTHFWKHV